MKNNQTSVDDIKNKLGLDTQKSRKFSWLWYGVVLLLVVGVAAYFLFLNKSANNIKYITQNIEKKDLVVKVSATGNIEPTNTVDVGIEVSGTLAEVYADFNQYVKKGEILARIDTTKLESRVKNAEAGLLVAQANMNERKYALEDATNELARGKKTLESTNGKYPSDKEFDALKINYHKSIATYNAAKGGVIQAEAQLKSDEDDLKKAVVKSPINGIVLDRKIEVGQSVVSSMQIPVLFTLAEDLSKMQLLLSVDEADIGEVHEGQQVEFTVDAYPEHTFEGVIVQVRFNSVIVSGVVTYSTVVEVDNSLLLLRPGMTATAEIITKVVKDSFVVPNAALRFVLDEKSKQTTKGKQIWILQNNTPKSIRIDSNQTDGILTSVSGDALSEGMQVIVNTLKEK
jgi:HlyD family secretion protein